MGWGSVGWGLGVKVVGIDGQEGRWVLAHVDPQKVSGPKSLHL